MLYLPDTNTVSQLMRGDHGLTHRFRLARREHHRFVSSPVVDYEIRRGLIRRGAKRNLDVYEAVVERFLYRDLTIDVWHTAARLWALSRDSGEPIEDADILIAAHALQLEAVLLTNNTRHYQVFRPLGLVLEDWTTH